VTYSICFGYDQTLLQMVGVNAIAISKQWSLDKVLNKFDILVEVVTNQGMEFRAEFQKLCEKGLINHRTNSQHHPKAKWWTKWMVQTMKDGLHNYGFQKGILKIGIYSYHG
jgi:hypothetical protein